MRDERLIRRTSVHYSGKETESPIPGYPNRPRLKSYAGEGVVRRSARADLVFGNHKAPTAYNAFSIEVKSNSFEAKGYPRGLSKFSNGKFYYTKEYNVWSGKRPLTIHEYASFCMTPGGLPYIPSDMKAAAAASIARKVKDVKASFGTALGESRESVGMVMSTAQKALSAISHALSILRDLFAKKEKMMSHERYSLLKNNRPSTGRTFSKEWRRPKPGESYDNWQRAMFKSWRLEATTASKRLRKNLRISKRKFVDAIQDPTTTLSELWLALKFGWLPLINDVYDLAEVASGKVANDFRKTKKVTSVERREDYVTVHPLFATTYSWKAHSATAQIESSATYRISSPDLSRMAQHGLDNPLTVAWELRPMSFVLDWFLPIKPWIDGLTTFKAVTFIHGYQSMVTTFDGTLEQQLYEGTYRCTGTGPSWSINCKAFQRVVLPTFVSPTVYIRSGLNPGKVGSLMALINAKTAR